MTETLLKRCYEALKSVGMDVRLAATPTEKCTAPYAAICEGAEEGRDKCTVYRHITAEILAPKDQAARLDQAMADVRTAMRAAGLHLTYASGAVIKDEYDALSISADFRALCAKNV